MHTLNDHLRSLTFCFHLFNYLSTSFLFSGIMYFCDRYLKCVDDAVKTPQLRFMLPQTHTHLFLIQNLSGTGCRNKKCRKQKINRQIHMYNVINTHMTFIVHTHAQRSLVTVGRVQRYNKVLMNCWSKCVLTLLLSYSFLEAENSWAFEMAMPQKGRYICNTCTGKTVFRSVNASLRSLW